VILKISNPIAGEGIASLCAEFIRGISIPKLLDGETSISRIDEGLGELPVMFIDTPLSSGRVETAITTSSADGEQGKSDIVHLKVADIPINNPVTPEDGEEGVVIVAVPETTDQFPVPTAGVFHASVVVVTLHKY